MRTCVYTHVHTYVLLYACTYARYAVHAPDPAYILPAAAAVERGAPGPAVVRGLLDERNVAGMHLPGQRAEAAAMRCKRASKKTDH